MGRVKSKNKSKKDGPNPSAARQQRYRDKMTDEKREEYRRKARERYNKRKEEKRVKPISELNKKEQKEKRKRWKKDSQNYRARIKVLKQVVSNTPPESSDELPINSSQPETTSRQKKAGRKQVRRDKAKVYRLLKKREDKIKDLEKKLNKYKKRLEREKKKQKSENCSPSPAKKVAEVLGKSNVSPAVKKRLFLSYALEKQIKSQLKGVSPKGRASHVIRRCIGNKIIKKYRIQNALKNILPYKFNKNVTNKPGLDIEYVKKTYATVKVKDAHLLQSFFEDDSVSKMCPGKRDIVRKGKVTKQRRVLVDTLENLYRRFIKDHGKRISESTFRRVKPFWIESPKSKDRETCACVVHTNMELLVFALKRANVITNGNLNNLIESVVCSIYNEKCMTGNCSKCNTNILKYEIGSNEELKYFKWVQVEEMRVIKGVEKKIKMTVKQKQICTPSSIKKSFFDQFAQFKKHVFNLMHQAKEYKQIRSNLKEGMIIFQVDFSQNYVAKYETEIQATHFGASKKQISLHTGLRYSFDNLTGKVKCHTFCTVSDNLDHNAFAVWAHLRPILEESSSSFPNTHTVHIFSDSPSSQYRNRANLHLMASFLPSYFEQLASFTWNFSEPGHGKGAMDGVGGAIKRSADFAVKHGADITCSADLVKTVGGKSKTWLLEVPSIDIETAKNAMPSTIPPVKGIMSLRQISYGRRGMFGRTLSCFQCPFDQSCKHYGLLKIGIKEAVGESSSSLSTSNQPKKEALQVSEVYTSSEESDSDVGSKPTQVPVQQFKVEDLKPGVFVVVEIKSQSKKFKPKSFVAVIQDDVDNDSELKVMFMRPNGNDLSHFFPNEKDISYIELDQILGILSAPKVVRKGNRIYHKFEGQVDLQ